MLELPPPLEALHAYKQFIIQKLIERPDGRLDKIPLHPQTLNDHNAYDPTIWLSAERALKLANTLGPRIGVGFVLTKDDPFFFLDIDDALTPTGWNEIATRMVATFPGAAVEVSCSGKGLHILGTGSSAIPDEARKTNKALGLELYTQKRVARLSGDMATGDVMTDCSHILPAIVNDLFPVREKATTADHGDGPRDDWNGPTDDDQLIQRMLNSRESGDAIFGNKATARQLWEADEPALINAYPDKDPKRPYDYSGADLGLANKLAFWTGCDQARMERLLKRSGLVREKWDDHPTYLADTVQRACDGQEKVYSVPPTPEVPADVTNSSIVGFNYIPITEQAEFFKGCVYISEMHKVIIENGTYLGPDQFRVSYGGNSFAQNGMNNKTTDNAWKVFTESQAMRFPKVDSVMFRPDLEPNTILELDGIRCVNTYRPIDTPSMEGDPSPILDLIATMLPDEHDQLILISYMAACVQHIGHKFAWAPLLQGAQGNGKTTISLCISRAIGKRYTHWPKADKLDSEFNAWLLANLFIGIEDIHVSDGRRQIVETLKPMITGGEGIEIQGKGDDQISKDICCNFVLNSNHRNPIRYMKGDRRFCVFFTAQQDDDHIARDGLDGDYFPDLYDWLNADGYAIMTNFLRTYEIPRELNPCMAVGGKAHRAPLTSTTNEVIEESMGGVEQEILEAIREGVCGFAGGWISSVRLHDYLVKSGMARRMPRSKRRAMLLIMGYDWHPGLPGGRVSKMIPNGEGRPILFCKRDEPSLMALQGEEVAIAYAEAQRGMSLPLGGEIFDRHPVSNDQPKGA